MLSFRRLFAAAPRFNPSIEQENKEAQPGHFGVISVFPCHNFGDLPPLRA
jgi:hypothetical protein